MAISLLRGGGYGSDDGQFDYPLGVALDASDNVYVGLFGQ